MAITHKYFGDIQTPTGESDVCWEKEFNLNNDYFTIKLWADSIDDLNSDNLDKFASFCQNLSKHDKNCREEMIKELHEDESYMTENLGEIQEQVNSPKLQKLIDDNATIEHFVAMMNLTNISLWADIDFSIGKPFISFDYMIDKEYSDEILCVRYDLEGNLIHVAHES